MNINEQREFNCLQHELDCARRQAEETRFFFSNQLGRSNDEARLYRGLFWMLLAVSAVFALVRLVQG